MIHKIRGKEGAVFEVDDEVYSVCAVQVSDGIWFPDKIFRAVDYKSNQYVQIVLEGNEEAERLLSVWPNILPRDLPKIKKVSIDRKTGEMNVLELMEDKDGF